MFFSEEKNQKTSTSPWSPISPAMAGIYPRAPEIKVFWFFSSEKNKSSLGTSPETRLQCSKMRE